MYFPDLVCPVKTFNRLESIKLGLFLLFCFLSLKMCSMGNLFISRPTNPPHHGSRLESQMALPEFSFEHLFPQMVVFFQGAVEPKEVGPV